jgi:photosystem II stability/assembly factor-like uncharacterized protein
VWIVARRAQNALLQNPISTTMMTRYLFIITLTILTLVNVVQASDAGRRPFPPQKPNPMPIFHVPAVGSSLDESWTFMDTLFDAMPAYPDLFSAFPVEIAFSKNHRGYLAMLHTVYYTGDAGESWDNLDLNPPPDINETWNAVRSPFFISGIGLRPTDTEDINGDSLLLAVSDGNTENGNVRVIMSFDSQLVLWIYPQFSTGWWITEAAAPTHNVMLAFAGLDGRIFSGNPQTSAWDTLDYNFFGTWIDDVEITGSRIIAAGSHHIISEDGGVTWNLFPAADSGGVRDLCFAPDGLHGLACGATSEQGGGWARWTDDGGLTWSERTLATVEPLYAATMLTDEIGYVAGGNINFPSGNIHRTSDGGQTWNLELMAPTEISVIGSSRANAAYVNVIAAGAFPDFSCGVWRSRVFLPVENGAVLIAEPDTLDFGLVNAGHTDTLSVTLSNIGNEAIFVTAVTSDTTAFVPLWGGASIELAPDAACTFEAVFAPDTSGDFETDLIVMNSDLDDVRIHVIGHAGIDAVDPSRAPIPASLAVRVWPNPGNAEFRIGYEIQRAQNISLSLYDLTGRLIANLAQGHQEGGAHVVSWNGSAQASGLYFVRLETETGQTTAKLMLVK